MKLNKILMALMFAGSALSSKAQQTVTAAGGDGAGAGGSVAYSIGQVAYTTNTAATGSVAQGIQQPYEIFLTEIREPVAGKITLSVFPNPTTGTLTLQVAGMDHAQLSYQLFDLEGKLLAVHALIADKTTIDMEQLAAAPYFIHIIRNTGIVQSFKVIKY
jgi:hypothetical protein